MNGLKVKSIAIFYRNLDKLMDEHVIRKEDITSCKKSVECLVALYDNSKRKFEDAFQYEHLINATNLMIDTYLKRKGSGDEFVELFREKPTESMISLLFHDCVEDEKLVIPTLSDVLSWHCGIEEKMNENVVANVDDMSMVAHSDSPIYSIVLKHYLNNLKKKEVPKFGKCFDIGDNFKSIFNGIPREQFKKVITYHLPYVQDVYPYFYEKLTKNVFIAPDIIEPNLVVGTNNNPLAIMYDVIGLNSKRRILTK